MEELLNQIWTEISIYVYVPYLVIFVFLSYTITKAFGKALQKATKINWQTVYTVLIIATLTGIPFIIWTDAGWVKILFSYAIGTTLYEIFFKFIGSKTK